MLRSVAVVAVVGGDAGMPMPPLFYVLLLLSYIFSLFSLLFASAIFIRECSFGGILLFFCSLSEREKLLTKIARDFNKMPPRASK